MDNYPLLNLFLTFLWFFLFVMWIWALIYIMMDIFRSRDIGGFAKALWLIFIIIIPWLGVLVYLIARGGSMADRSMKEAADNEAAFKAYVQQTAGSGTSAAEQLEKLAALKASGALTDDEFAAQKAKILSS